jgi:hypothetical protein
MAVLLNLFFVMRILFLTRQIAKLIKRIIFHFLKIEGGNSKSYIGNFFYFRPVIVKNIKLFVKI